MKKFFKNIVWPSLRIVQQTGNARGIWLVFLLLLQTGLDLLSVASIFPLAIAMVQPEFINQFLGLQKVMRGFGFFDEVAIRIFLITLVAFFFVIKHIAGVYITRYRTTYAFALATNISKRLMQQSLQQPYNTYYKQKASGELVNVVHLPAAFAQNILLALTSLLIEGLVLIGIVAVIISYNFLSFFFLTALSVPALLYYRMIRQKLSSIGSIQKENYPLLIHRVLSAFDSFLEINIYQKARTVVNETDTLTERLNRLQIQQAIHYVSGLRFFETMAALGLCVLVVYLVFLKATAEESVFLIGIYSAAGVRAIPSVNRIMAALFQIKSNEYVISDIDTRLKTLIKVEDDPDIEFNFKQSIFFKDVSFGYADRSLLISGMDFFVAKGSKIFITGKSGSGKSTVLLLLMGFLKPTSGAIEIDSNILNHSSIIAWQKNLSYVPQNPVLVNGSILLNIAFESSVEKIDEKKIIALIQKLGMESWIQQLPNGLHTELGERGIQISGGQRQRLAIARALYMNREIILLDEVTSNLDDQASQELIQMITLLPQTVIMVTHDQHLSTYFKESYNLENGTLMEM